MPTTCLPWPRAWLPYSHSARVCWGWKDHCHVQPPFRQHLLAHNNYFGAIGRKGTDSRFLRPRTTPPAGSAGEASQLSRTPTSETFRCHAHHRPRTEQKCYDFLNSLRLIPRATNLFDSKSLAIHPYSTIFVNFTPEEKKKMDVSDTTIRLSMGLEDVNDLYEDIVQELGQ